MCYKVETCIWNSSWQKELIERKDASREVQLNNCICIYLSFLWNKIRKNNESCNLFNVLKTEDTQKFSKIASY